MEAVAPDLPLGAVPPRSAACEALITEIATRIEPRVDAVAVQLIDRVVAEMDLPADDEDLREDLVAAARGSVALITANARTWTDPHIVPAPHDALIWARSLVARGLAIDSLLRVYRIGQSGYHDLWHRELGDGDPAVALEAARAISAFIFTWIDAIAAPLVEAYEDELGRRERGADAIRAETVAEVLGGGPIDVGSASARLGYELERSHVGILAWVEPTAPRSSHDDLERVAGAVATALADCGGRPLVLRQTPRSVVGWVARASLEEGTLDTLRATLAGTGVRVSLGSPADGVAGFRTTHDQARRGRRVARLLRRSSPVVRYSDVAVTDLLTRDPEAARVVAAATLGPLGADNDSARRLLATLRVFLQEGQSYARTARRLGLHENTVAYRVRRAVELSGQPSVEAHALRAAVELAPLLETAASVDDEH